MDPTGFFICAGIFAIVALATLVSGLHPRWRHTATWHGLIRRSPSGSVLFSAGALMMSSGMVVRAIIEQHGPMKGLVLWLFAGGAVVLALGPLCDLVQRKRHDDAS